MCKKALINGIIKLWTFWCICSNSTGHWIQAVKIRVCAQNVYFIGLTQCRVIDDKSFLKLNLRKRRLGVSCNFLSTCTYLNLLPTLILQNKEKALRVIIIIEVALEECFQFKDIFLRSCSFFKVNWTFLPYFPVNSRSSATAAW